MDKKAFKSVMRYSTTLKNALNHFVITAEEKQNRLENCTFGSGFTPAAMKNAQPTPLPPPLPFFFFPYWSLSGLKSDMRHVSPGLELSLRGPHSEHH